MISDTEQGRRDKIAKAMTRHGREPRALYQVWVEMRARCRNPKNKSYQRYGARGITVCPEWDADFVFFRDWALSGEYGKGLWIERINNNKGYSPDNCKWATIKEQSINRSTTRLIEYRGAMVLLATLAKSYSIPTETLRSRIGKLGWPIELALTKPVGRR